MDQKRELTAAKILNEYEQEDLERIFKEFGELRNAKPIVNRIMVARNEAPIKTIEQLKEVIQDLVPEKHQHKFLAQVFQALRIEVNEELAALEEFLEQSAELLKPGGRLVIMSYHSLEDRMVKNFINAGNVLGKQEKDFFGNVLKPLQSFNRKPITASVEEIQGNNRARSAKLRIAIKEQNGSQ
jgi:16S rRNA (cytosine1402-N4)-methyltransferase